MMRFLGVLLLRTSRTHSLLFGSAYLLLLRLESDSLGRSLSLSARLRRDFLVSFSTLRLKSRGSETSLPVGVSTAADAC